MHLLIGDTPGFTLQVGYQAATLDGELSADNYFKWFHAMGHEINHRGQIRWRRSRALRPPG